MVRRKPVSYGRLSSPFGPIMLVWHRPAGAVRVLRIILPGGKITPPEALAGEFLGARHIRSGAHPDVDRLTAGLDRFLGGRPVDFSLTVLDLAVCGPFQRRVLEAEFQVPRGRVTAYSRLAERIGAPGAARAVGNALSRNPFPLIIPCHRCVREDGTLGGFRGGLKMKRTLLEMEGIGFDQRGRVEAEYML